MNEKRHKHWDRPAVKHMKCDEAESGKTAQDREILKAIRDITNRGNDAEVRRKRDGKLVVYEVKKNVAVG